MKKYNTLLILLALTAATTTIAQKKQLYTAPLGIESYTFRNSFPVNIVKTLDTIQKLGFTEYEGESYGMPAAEFKKLCSNRGIKIISTGADYGELVKSPEAVAHKAKNLGAKYVMCAWIPHANSGFTLENAKNAVEVFNKAGKILKDSGIIFCYHAHGYEFQPYQNGTLLDYLIKNTNPKYVSFEMDILWIHFGGGDPVALLKKYGNRWKLMHLKDLKKGTKKDLSGGTSQENDVALGTGEINIPAILKEAKKVGIKHYFIEDESNHPGEQVPKSIAYLKSLKE
ncbi:MAG: sugar phosphate isomerase/epimerase [Bacteroidota bacterium]|nr:sugar phosphate isomerase/epimerase [Bacteroidota bacterium]